MNGSHNFSWSTLLFFPDYRANHYDAPRPDMPSRGVVLAQSEEDQYLATSSKNKKSKQGWTADSQSSSSSSSSLPPLRLLVIGDSLAAGVGMSESSTPALPEAIASALSASTAAGNTSSSARRVVYWTCVGTPGTSSIQLVQEIQKFVQQQEERTQALLLSRQEKQRPLLQEPLVRFQRWRQRTAAGLQQWWKLVQEPVDLAEKAKYGNPDERKQQQQQQQQQQQETEASNRLQKWWKRTVLRFKRDTDLWKRFVVEREGQPPLEEVAQDTGIQQPTGQFDETDQSQQQQLLLTQETAMDCLARHNTLENPAFDINQFDIAVVLTGLNDLKDTFLPFMMSAQRARMLQEMKRQEEGEENMQQRTGLQGELLRVVKALKTTMKKSLPAELESMIKRRTSLLDDPDDDEDEDEDDDDDDDEIPRPLNTPLVTFDAPLVVFPALPITPIELSQRAPLGWFLVPIIRAMDHNKKILAESYPELLLFVESPSVQDILEVEKKRGPLWENEEGEGNKNNDRSNKTVLLKLTDAAANVRGRVEEHMRSHYKSLVQDRQEEETSSLYELCADDVLVLSRTDHGVNRHRHPGASMVSADGVHPNDSGYKFFGRLIARAILEKWEREQSAATPLSSSSTN